MLVIDAIEGPRSKSTTLYINCPRVVLCSYVLGCDMNQLDSRRWMFLGTFKFCGSYKYVSRDWMSEAQGDSGLLKAV